MSGKPLENPRHEAFAQYLSEGKTQAEAYELAGYKPNRGNATTLANDQSIVKRVEALMERRAKQSDVTVESLTKRLLDIATKGEGKDDASLLSVARAALMDAAKLNGLIVDRAKVEAENVNYDISDKPLTDDEWERDFGSPNTVASAAGAASSVN